MNLAKWLIGAAVSIGLLIALQEWKQSTDSGKSNQKLVQSTPYVSPTATQLAQSIVEPSWKQVGTSTHTDGCVETVYVYLPPEVEGATRTVFTRFEADKKSCRKNHTEMVIASRQQFYCGTRTEKTIEFYVIDWQGKRSDTITDGEVITVFPNGSPIDGLYQQLCLER